ncbi:alpha/beta hydrolase [Microbacterium sp. zg-Y818]|uniref:alpha/beta hydrolase n=1 Tax=unclassified Microbacterium TaxID=2609290 RepID=UPI00214C32B6|nr:MULTISPECIES: alpha/beta hydrolase [unclassified Microbacterium]MCR2800127.1 alpha/beta hydrolase [Microbacterium sp. zg.Y818]WIM22098.1 alpha/beta hydrolase [Microbacterium sp. zg-Y818]
MTTDPFPAAGGLLRVYPATEPDGSGLVWAHGGGFHAGDLDMPEAQDVATALATRGTTVMSVDYRLVREGCRYPAPSDDVLAAWSWALDSAARLAIDRGRLAIGGASAGGNLAAGAVLRLMEGATSTLPALVVLAYPTLLAVQPPPGAALRAALDAQPDADRFGPAVVRTMYENFLGAPVQDAPLAAVPARATAADLAAYPRTLLINGDVDELRVGAEVFAATLEAAGRPVQAIIEPGTQHGHLNRPDQPAFTASIDRIAEALAALPRG